MGSFRKFIHENSNTELFIQALIILDIVLITWAMFFALPQDLSKTIKYFDFVVCIILLIQWTYHLHNSESKSDFFKRKSNWIDLIASIPFDVVLPAVVPQVAILRYLRLLKLLRIIALFNRFFNGFSKFLKNSNLDKILGGVFFTILIFTLVVHIYGSKYNLFDSFYFVIVTLTTVGYGDVLPHTVKDKAITIVLIFCGVFVFSTITAAISSYLTDRLLTSNDLTIEEAVEELLEEKVHPINDELKDIKNQLELSNRQNDELKEEIKELKELIKSK